MKQSVKAMFRIAATKWTPLNIKKNRSETQAESNIYDLTP